MLGVGTVALAAHEPDGLGVLAVPCVDGGVDDDAATEERVVDALADRDDDAGGVCTLDARQIHRALPAGAGSGKAVGALAGPDVGVVERRRAHAHEHLARAGRRHGHLGELEHLGASVLGEAHGPHGLGDGLGGLHDGLLPAARTPVH
ncbi:hypothetical protein OVA14_03785 [Agrococcus sp. SL85]|nr:hypothetical protein [Agrococcus sp. SL85]WAC66903.1 hypothetical protein OVA14_03785 [Agrococcus sp. SL85]